MANVVGQVGCVTGLVAIGIIAIAFGAGWYLDNLMGNERRIATILFLLGSFPVTLFAMIRISLFLVERAQKQVETIMASDQNSQEKESTQI
ncbi:MAG: hypothetical protein Kow0080_15640 [Candidatus Promineifilaceae bacterium]|jgi:uncharacterized membrane protein YpjA